MQKKIIIKLTLFVSVIFLLSSCTSGSGKESTSQGSEKPIYEWGTIEGKTVSVWGDRDDLSRPYISSAFEAYQEQTNNKINIVSLSKDELDNKVPIAFASDTKEKPDLLFQYGGTNVENLDPDKNFYDFTQAPWIDDLSDTAINQSIFNGKVIGLPYGEVSVSGTLYNKKIFKDLGIKIPQTQDEFLDVCETLLQNGITPMYLPYAEITMLLYQFPMDSIFTNKDTLDRINNGTLSYSDIPEMKKIVQWYKDMSDRGYFGEDYLSNDWDGMSPAMENEKYAMMLCWDTWLYTNFSGDPSKFGLMPAFMGTPENGCFEGANILLCIANKNSPQLEVALDLINFMVDPCNYNISFAGLYTAPIFNNQRGSISTPQYMESEMLINKLFYDSTTWSRVRGFSQIDAKYIQQYMRNECSIDECLSLMDGARTERARMQSYITPSESEGE